MNASARWAHLALILSGILFGANYWIAKSLMPDYLSATQIIVFRTVGATLLFSLLLPFTRRTSFSGKEWLLLLLCGISGVTINQFMFFTGLNLTTPVEASLLHTISPIVVMLLARWMIKEKTTPLQTLGVLIGFAGAIWLTVNGKALSWDSAHLKGNVFILINITAYSIYLVLAKPLMARHDPLWVVFWIFFFGMLAFLPFSMDALKSIPQLSLPYTMQWVLVYVVVGTTFLTYLLTIYALRKLSSGTVGAYIYLQPFISVAIGVITGYELMTGPKIISGLLIFMGVFLVNLRTVRFASAGVRKAIKKRF